MSNDHVIEGAYGEKQSVGERGRQSKGE